MKLLILFFTILAVVSAKPAQQANPKSFSETFTTAITDIKDRIENGKMTNKIYTYFKILLII